MFKNEIRGLILSRGWLTIAALVVTAGCTSAEPFNSRAFRVNDGPDTNLVGSGGTGGFDAGGPALTGTGGSILANDAGPSELFPGTGGGSGGAITDASGSGGSGGAMTDASGGGGSAGVLVGPVGYWKLDEGNGSTINDSSGNKNAGALSGSPSWASTDNSAPTKFTNPSALVFNGSSQYARIPRTPTLEPTSFTVSLWAKRTGGAVQVKFAKIFEKQYMTADPFLSIALNINHTNDDPSVVTLDVSQNVAGIATARNISSPSGAMPDGAWTHIVGIYDPAGSAPQERLYINGVLIASAIYNDPMAYDPTATGDIYLGKSGRDIQYFAGSIDDVRFYNRPLTDAEISSLYAGN